MKPGFYWVKLLNVVKPTIARVDEFGDIFVTGRAERVKIGEIKIICRVEDLDSEGDRAEVPSAG